MRSKCRKYKLEHDLKLIIIDYLQLMSGSGKGSDSRQQEISDISRSLKALARELSVPVIALSQLSRAVEQRPDHRPMLSDLRESGAIEQDADVVMFIYRDDYYNHDSEMKGISEIIIAKQRNGPIGTVNLVWLPQYTKFANMEKINQYRRGVVQFPAEKRFCFSVGICITPRFLSEKGDRFSLRACPATLIIMVSLKGGKYGKSTVYDFRCIQHGKCGIACIALLGR